MTTKRADFLIFFKLWKLNTSSFKNDDRTENHQKSCKSFDNWLKINVEKFTWWSVLNISSCLN